ncbi:MAG TPA: hypothetical protein VFJ16_28070 [Longimicrobium sp.]|nr:hypothetical protein [Longimicrobium sp.]
MEASARPITPGHPLPTQSPAAVALYIDRSGSMNGYLDAENADSGQTVHASGANLRTTLTRLLAVGGEQTAVYGFGERVTSLPALTQSEVLGQLFSQRFYNQNDTRTEDVLAQVRADSERASVHLVVTDGRRGSGESAIAQYQRMGEVASWWTARGGVFAVAASMSPFTQVRGDRAGCWQSAPSSAGRCPLYVFAFIPATAAERTLAILDGVSDRLYAYPPPSDARVRIEHATASQQGPGSVGVVRGQPFVLGFRAQGRPNQPVTAQVTLTFHADESAARFALDDSLTWRLDRALLGRKTPEWTDAGDVSDDWVQPGRLRTGAGSTLVLPLTVRSYAGLAPTLYRIRISSAGLPRWVREYEAVQQRDSLRTYGLSALLTQLQPQPAVLAGAQVTVY